MGYSLLAAHDPAAAAAKSLEVQARHLAGLVGQFRVGPETDRH